METKTLHVEIKDENQGVVTARFATLGVKDKEGDVILPGAFGEQQVKVSAYGHGSWAGALPVGVGETRESGDEAIADLEFFMSTTHGRDHFETIKGLGDLGEWSFGFDILEEAAPDEEQREQGVERVLKRLAVHEVSPVLRGAGVGTRTLSVKCDACAAKGDTDPAEEFEAWKERAKTMRDNTGDTPDEAGESGAGPVEADAGQDEVEAATKTKDTDDLGDLVAQATGRVELLRKKMATW